jgi:hypothetical protein
VTAGKTSPSPLRIKRSFRNVAIRHQSVVRLAVRQRKTIKVVGAPVTVRLQRRVLLSFVQDVASPQPCLSNLGAIVRCSAGIATRRAKVAAAGAEASGIAGGNSCVDLLHDSGPIGSGNCSRPACRCPRRELCCGRASSLRRFSSDPFRGWQTGAKKSLKAGSSVRPCSIRFCRPKQPSYSARDLFVFKVVHTAHGPIN